MSMPIYIYFPALVSHSHISVRLKHSGNLLHMSEHVLTETSISFIEVSNALSVLNK